jgi:hypothetical protein
MWAIFRHISNVHQEQPTIHKPTKKLPMIETSNALEEMRKLDQEYQERKRAIQGSVIQEIVRAISTKKQELAELESQYTSLTGKNLKGEKTGIRRRLSAEDQKVLQTNVEAFLRSKPQGAKMKEIVASVGENNAAVRRAISQIPSVRSEGAKAATVYKIS